MCHGVLDFLLSNLRILILMLHSRMKNIIKIAFQMNVFMPQLYCIFSVVRLVYLDIQYQLYQGEEPFRIPCSVTEKKKARLTRFYFDAYICPDYILEEQPKDSTEKSMSYNTLLQQRILILYYTILYHITPLYYIVQLFWFFLLNCWHLCQRFSTLAAN